MNFFKKGPELKLSEIKVPDFLLDVYCDLKERHLLPVAAILLIAIVVVPLALTQSGKTEGEANPAVGATASTTGVAESTRQMVAKSTPPLREYKRRLAHLEAKNPFVQKYTGRESEPSETSNTSPEGASTAGVGDSSTQTAPSEAPQTSPTSPSEPSPPPSEGGPEGAPQHLRWYSYAIDVRVVTPSDAKASSSDAPQKPKPTVRHNLPELTMLPSRKTPAIIYMGSTKDGKKALMLVSSDVTAIFGDAKCVLGSQTCQLLAMEPNLPETFVYGGSGKTYKIELRQIHLVESSKINRAPLGDPPKKSKGK